MERSGRLCAPRKRVLTSKGKRPDMSLHDQRLPEKEHMVKVTGESEEGAQVQRERNTGHLGQVQLLEWEMKCSRRFS